MDIPLIIERALEIVDGIVESAYSDVLYYAWIGASGDHGEPDFDSPVLLRGLVDFSVKTLYKPNGDEEIQKATIGFVLPLVPNGAVDRTEPVDLRDKFVLANGYTGPILRINAGLINPNTRLPFLADIILG